MQFLPELELIDRLCIARVKYERTSGGNQAELDWYESRYQELRDQLTAEQQQTLEYNIREITEIHNQIWNLEWQLKSGVEYLLELSEIGARAIAIRDWNNKRISYKNSIAELFGLKLREIKTDHLSANPVDNK
jgi:transposase